MLSIDAEKALNSFTLNFLYQVLGKTGFNDQSMGIVQTFCGQPTARIKINGNLTDKISLQRSTRQGCGLSLLHSPQFLSNLWCKQYDKVRK